MRRHFLALESVSVFGEFLQNRKWLAVERKVLTPGKYKVKTILLVRIRAVVKPLKRAKTVVVPR